jgi:hypothetical protein
MKYGNVSGEDRCFMIADRHMLKLRRTRDNDNSWRWTTVRLILPNELVQLARTHTGVSHESRPHFIHHILLELHDCFKTQRTSGSCISYNIFTLNAIRHIVLIAHSRTSPLLVPVKLAPQALALDEVIHFTLAIEWVINKVIHFAHQFYLQLHHPITTQRIYDPYQLIHPLCFTFHYLDGGIQETL